MAKKKAKPEKIKGEVRAVPMVWDSPDGLETIYVNHFALVRSGPEVYLIFGELAMPIVRSEKEIPEAFHITPKVRLAVTPEQMKAIADVISQNAKDIDKGKDDNAG